MTGKEALINLSKTCKELELEYGNFKINKKDNEALQTLKEIVQKYDKYKRAFEILKEYSHLPPLEKFVYEEDGNYYAARIEEYDVGSDIPITYHYLLDKEEYELLEELMSNENG